MKNRVAIVGAGMTLFRRRMLESPKELSFEATRMALDSAGLELKDIQSVVSGSAAVRLLEHLRPDPRETSWHNIAVDFLVGDEAVHAQVRDQGGGDRERRREEQGKRCGSSLRTTRR